MNESVFAVAVRGSCEVLASKEVVKVGKGVEFEIAACESCEDVVRVVVADRVNVSRFVTPDCKVFTLLKVLSQDRVAGVVSMHCELEQWADLAIAC